MAWLSVDFESKKLHMPVSVEILMPQGHGGYKTLYLLHGAGGDRSSWLLKSRIADYAEKNNLAVVLPSGDNSFYVNNRHGKDYMDFISEELISLCNIWFSVSQKKEDRMIAGMSMGGYGAFAAALNNPDIFGYAASFSGLMDIMDRYDNPRGLDLYPAFGTREELINSNGDLFHIVVDNSSNFTGLSGENTKFYIMCGKKDKNFLMNQKMADLMKEQNYSIQFSIDMEGNHDWDYWDICIKNIIEIFVKEGRY